MVSEPLTIATARTHYLALVERATVASPGDAGYIAALSTAWLAEFDRLGDERVVAGRPYLDWLLRCIAADELRPDDLVEWVDAYPDAIVDRCRAEPG